MRRWPAPFIYNMSPGEGREHWCRLYCQESHTQHSQPQSVLHHFWYNSKKKKNPNQALFTGKQGVLAQPFNTHLKPGKEILAKAVKCPDPGRAKLPNPDAPLGLCNSQAEQKQDPEHLCLAFWLIQRLCRRLQLSGGWQNSWFGAGASRNAINTRCKGAQGFGGLFSWTLYLNCT